ncbi:uncharacterized protein LOC123673509 [Harmonia axyridis]|uniref:uncharacterized protein LOC123673509 n=1 Tax=Harmonia axyridis TaxID=115357 RepID=UPI001E274EB5|nr:uncharacterized protein LOC123673509 [Harmonia axyridis]
MPIRYIHRQFLEATPKKPEEVRLIWNFVHILLLSLTAFSGWVAAYSFGLYLGNFKFQCILFAKLMVVTEHSVKKHNLTIFSNASLWDAVLPRSAGHEIDIKRSRWGEPRLCDFVQFLHVASMLSSLIWIVFFSISGRGSTVLQRQIIGKPHRLVFPFLTWSIVSALAIFVTNSTLTGGLINFCSIIEHSNGNKEVEICFGTFIESYRIFFGSQQGSKLFGLFLITKFAGYIGFIVWICNAFWSCLRVYLIIDFKFYMVTVWKYAPDRDDREDSRFRRKKSVTFYEKEKE